MSETAIADVTIHLRARAQDRTLIDQAAELAGANRSQFMLASALEEAMNVLLDQSALLVQFTGALQQQRPTAATTGVRLDDLAYTSSCQGLTLASTRFG